ncbi:MAG: MBOAT family protein, partial [Bdellovibrionales bacterium]|nr:MBOAT family protein [Bdellovibrionales bacterium]
MVFSSFIFIYIFLPIFLTLYFLFPGKLKNLIALLGSLTFYAWGAPTILPLLIVSAFIDFILSAKIQPVGQNLTNRRFFLFLGVGVNILFLGYFKYSGFFIEELNSLLLSLNLESVSWGEVVLPIGISFFTFQKISYLIDVYRGATPRAPNFLIYLLFVTLFPQLIAGPIVRYKDIATQLMTRCITLDMLFSGICRFGFGLGKKVLIADPLGAVTDNVLALSGSEITIVYAWLGIICYAFQIYFDFSGYSDMAIGLGKMMGFDFPENFNRPYISRTITEFWRRWHITLSSWMKDYLYIPLGGNRVSTNRMYINLWIVFIL